MEGRIEISNTAMACLCLHYNSCWHRRDNDNGDFDGDVVKLLPKGLGYCYCCCYCHCHCHCCYTTPTPTPILLYSYNPILLYSYTPILL